MKKKELKSQQREVLISSRKADGKVVTNRQIINPRRKIIERTPIIDEEWEKFFNDHQYGFGADMQRSHGMDLATEENPMGPWFDRFP